MKSWLCSSKPTYLSQSITLIFESHTRNWTHHLCCYQDTNCTLHICRCGDVTGLVKVSFLCCSCWGWVACGDVIQGPSCLEMDGRAFRLCQKTNKPSDEAGSSDGVSRWMLFPGGQLSGCWCCVQLLVETVKADQEAVHRGLCPGSSRGFGIFLLFRIWSFFVFFYFWTGWSLLFIPAHILHCWSRR